MTESDKPPPDKLPIQEALQDDHLRAIGMVIAQWAQVDSLLLAAVCEIAGFPRDTGFIVINRQDARTKIGLLRTLVTEYHPDYVDQFSDLADRLNKAYGKRNDYAHLRWEKGQKKGTISPVGAKTVGKLSIAKGEITANDIEQFARDLWMLGNELLAFLNLRGLLLDA